MKKYIFIVFVLIFSILNGRDKNEEKMDMMLAWKITEHLKLTNEQAEKFFPIFREYREDLKNLNAKEKDLNSNIKQKIERGDSISNSDLDRFLNDLSDVQKKKFEIKKNFIFNLDGKLNNVQKAKMIGFEHRFRKEVRKQIKDHKKGWKKEKYNSHKSKGFWK